MLVTSYKEHKRFDDGNFLLLVVETAIIPKIFILKFRLQRRCSALPELKKSFTLDLFQKQKVWTKNLSWRFRRDTWSRRDVGFRDFAFCRYTMADPMNSSKIFNSWMWWKRMLLLLIASTTSRQTLNSKRCARFYKPQRKVSPLRRGSLSAGTHSRCAAETMVVRSDTNISQVVQRFNVKNSFSTFVNAVDTDGITELLVEIAIVNLRTDSSTQR